MPDFEVVIREGLENNYNILDVYKEGDQMTIVSTANNDMCIDKIDINEQRSTELTR